MNLWNVEKIGWKRSESIGKRRLQMNLQNVRKIG